jgi:hypothetical protein
VLAGKGNNLAFHEQLTGILLLSLEELGDLVTDIALGHADVVLLLTLVIDEVEETIVGDIDLQTRRLGLIAASEDWGLPTSWYSVRLTTGTSMLWVEGQRSSSFFPVKISMATRWTLA